MDNNALSREEQKRAETKALRLLAYGPRSKKGLYKKLTESGFSTDAAEYATAKMEEYGYLDDRKMAADYVAYAIEQKGHGRLRVMQDLYKHGVDKAVAAEALEEYFSDTDDDPELEAAASLLEKRLSRQGIEPSEMDEGDKRRAFGFLARRGYSFGTIKKAFRALGQSAEGYDEDY